MPAQQRVSVLTAPETLQVETRDVPVPGPGEVQVAVRAVSVCGSDVHLYDFGEIAGFEMDGPLVLGHETGGEVTALGEGVDAPAVGTRVSLEPQTTCGSCEQCRAGLYNLCPWVEFFATPPIDGSFAEYVTVPAERAHPVPDTMSDEAAALIEPLAVALHAVGKTRVGVGTHVLVSGAGPVGLMCLQVALVHGASRVTVTDVDGHRRGVALDFGATAAVDPADPGEVERAGVVLECTGVQAAVDFAIARAAPAADVVLVGTAPTVTLPLGVVQSRELVVHGTWRYRHLYPAAIELAASGRVRLDEMVTSHHGLDDAAGALLAPRRDATAIKAVVHPDREETP